MPVSPVFLRPAPPAPAGYPLRTTVLAGLLAVAGCAGTGSGPAATASSAAPQPVTTGFGGAALARGMAAATAAPRAAASAPAPASAAVAASAASSAASSPAPAPVPGQPPPFALVMKDAQKIDALFTAWRKDEKLWLELRPEDFNKSFFFSPKLASGIGEAGLYGGRMLPSPRLVQWRRLYNVVQLVAVNDDFIAKPGTPEARALAAAASNSLVTAYPVASLPHPERKTVLVDASAMFVSDLLGLGAQLQRSYRQGYAFDGRNSGITGVRGKPDLLVIETSQHYATAALAVVQPGTPPGAPVPTVPDGLPDPRSLFLGLHYSLARLPEQPMASRAADPRIGHFTTVVDDYSDDLARSPRKRMIDRWRLEKKDPAAALSEPVKPITYWLDRSVPLKYRAALTAGVLEWNKAFEAIGFKDAIVVRQQADDADFDTLDAGIASIRWMVNHAPGFVAIGPSHVDPRSGEILDANIALESLEFRRARQLRAKVLGGSGPDSPAGPASPFSPANPTNPADWARLLQVSNPTSGASTPGGAVFDRHACQHAAQAAEQLAYGLDVLAARGDINPDSPEAQQFVQDFLKEVVMHEVGHTLGLRHNFRASHVFSEAQVTDPVFTRSNAFSGSVMEYTPINLPRPGEAPAAPYLSTLGPYDYWAIEYAYKPLAPADEAAELQRIASRSAEPALAYATDEDNFLGIDPDALLFDLGNDPLAFAARRFDIAQDLFQRQETRTLKPDEDYGSLRRVLGYAVQDAGRAAGILLRQIGGVRTLRDFAGSGRDPLQPVPAADQRAALQLLSQRLLAANSFAISPALQRRLAPDFFERSDSPGGVPTEFPLAQTVLDLQRALLNRLMGDALAARVLDVEGKVSPPAQPLRLNDLYSQLEADIWSELASKADIPQPRRDLQREHINRLTSLVLRPGALSRTDARALLRGRAAALALRIERAAKLPGLSVEARAHLQDSSESLRSALAAPLARVGV